MDRILELLIILGVLVIAITIHEFSHALVARLLGDRTAERMGRLSLNPLVHLDPMGTLMILVSALSGFGIGWGKPTPVNPWNLKLRGRTGMALVALGGPLANFALATILALLCHALPLAVAITSLPYPIAIVTWQILTIAAQVNLGLTAFNLLPLPMLDGFHILMGVIGAIRTRWAYNLGDTLARLEPHGPMILLILVMLGSFMHPSILTLAVTPVYSLLTRLLGLGRLL